MEETPRTTFQTGDMTFQCHLMGSVDSTNKVALGMVKQGAPEGTVVTAREQTMGKGRMGRRWESPEGGLWMTVVLRPKTDTANIPMLNLLGGIAVARGITTSVSLEPKVRWPNDILTNGKKLCGILSELSSTSPRDFAALIGIGVNCNFPASQLAPELARGSTTLSDELGSPIDLKDLKRAILTGIAVLYSDFQREDGPQRVLEIWKGWTDTLGHRVQVSWENNVIQGLAMDIDVRGNLLVKQDDGIVKTAVAGDCRYLD